MVIDVCEKKIIAETYQKRAHILLNYLKKTPISQTVELVDCSCSVNSLANFIFKDTPSFQEISSCQAGCSSRIKSVPSITIIDRELKEALGLILRNRFVLPDVKCCRTNCANTEDNEIYNIGLYFLLMNSTEIIQEIIKYFQGIL